MVVLLVKKRVSATKYKRMSTKSKAALKRAYFYAGFGIWKKKRTKSRRRVRKRTRRRTRPRSKRRY